MFKLSILNNCALGVDTASTRVWRGLLAQTAHGTSQSRKRAGAPATGAPVTRAHAQQRAAATQAHYGLAPGQPVPAGGRAPPGSRGERRAMEQRLAEFRAARKRAGLAAEPSTSSRSAQTSGEKAEATATPKSAPGWLKRFLVWKPRPAGAAAQPSLAQVRGGRPSPRHRALACLRGFSGNSG